MCAACFHEKGVCTSQYCCIFHTVLCVPCTVCCFASNGFVAAWNLKRLTKHVWCLCKLQNKCFSMVCFTNLCWNGAGKQRGERQCHYCWRQQHVHSRTAQLSVDSRGPTCIADLDSGALALTNTQNRPALLQLNRPLGTAMSSLVTTSQHTQQSGHHQLAHPQSGHC